MYVLNFFLSFTSVISCHVMSCHVMSCHVMTSFNFYGSLSCSRTYTQIHARSRTRTHIHTHIYSHINSRIYIRTYSQTYVYTHTNIHTHTCIHPLTHAHVRTYLGCTTRLVWRVVSLEPASEDDVINKGMYPRKSPLPPQAG